MPYRITRVFKLWNFFYGALGHCSERTPTPTPVELSFHSSPQSFWSLPDSQIVARDLVLRNICLDFPSVDCVPSTDVNWSIYLRLSAYSSMTTRHTGLPKSKASLLSILVLFVQFIDDFFWSFLQTLIRPWRFAIGNFCSVLNFFQQKPPLVHLYVRRADVVWAQEARCSHSEQVQNCTIVYHQVWKHSVQVSHHFY